MMKSLSKLILCIAVLSSCSQSASLAPQEDQSYYGDSANEAEYSFDAYVLMSKSKGEPTEASLNSELKTVAKYVMGIMRDDGSISYSFKSKKKKVETIGENYKVTYNMSGRGIFRSKFSDSYEFYVPVAPASLFDKSEGKCGGLEGGDSSSFWHLWEPRTKDCPLVKDEHYLVIKSPLKIIKATQNTYPEYEKLMDGQTLTATIFYGAYDHANKNWNPLDNSVDAGAEAYRRDRKFLIDLGFVGRQFEELELREIYNPQDSKKLPFAEDFTKISENGKVMRVRMLFLETQSSSSNSEAFHYFYMRALKADSVILYIGHSGLGANLNLDRIEKRHETKITLNPKYQIIHFGSCIPYAYYADMYFKRKVTSNDKNGTKGLDIFAYAKEAYFQSTEGLKVLSALDKYVFTGEKTSYQNMVTSTPENLWGILGDEDNN